MANHRILIPFLLRWEGGFVNDPHDRGGATNKGVTIATWKRYCKQHGKVSSVETLKAMIDAEWEDIFKSYYWDKCKADKINDQSIANLMVDWFYNSGYAAIYHVQKIVGVKCDGIVGRKTLAALNGFPPHTLFCVIHKDRIRFVDGIARRDASKRVFLEGWHNRINAIQYGHLELE